VLSVKCRHSIDAFQPPSRAAGGQSSSDTPETPTDTTLPNIVRPCYNDLRSADDAVEADVDGSSEQPGSLSDSQVIDHLSDLFSVMRKEPSPNQLTRSQMGQLGLADTVLSYVNKRSK